MNWFRENRFLGRFVIAFALATLVATYLLFAAKGSFDEATTKFAEATNERARLERLDPFPNETNVRKMKTHIENYTASLDRLRADLKTRVPAPPPLAPDQFQVRLRQSVNAISDRAKANKVKLPESFYLGFDEFASSLPTTEAAPLLGQQLSQIELLMTAIIDARVESVASFKRVGAVQPASPATPPGGPKIPNAPVQNSVDRTVVEFAFTGQPSASRKVINQISSTADQLFVIRALHVRNERDKGPARTPTADASAPPSAPIAKSAASPAIQFIVGNEKLETSARVELVRFTF